MRRIILLIALLLVCGRATAQNPGTGIPAFGSFTNGGFDTINNQNLNTYIGIPIAASAGRGMPLSISLVYNSLIWQNVGGSWAPATDSSGNPTWGWQKDFPVGGSVSYYITGTTQVKCFQGSQWHWAYVTSYSNYTFNDVLGTGHSFSSVHITSSDCAYYNNKGQPKGYSDDASGYYLDISSNPEAPRVTDPGGIIDVNGNGTAVDANGNYVTKTINSGNSSEADWTDSVGNLALKIIYVPNNTSPTSIKYEFLDGTSTGGVPNYQTITLKLQSLPVKTNFGCSGVTEDNGTATVPLELDVPTPAGGTLKYQFSYEPTPGNPTYSTGRLQQVTLPTGGYYEYTYGPTNDGINCSDGTTLSMNRIVNDGVRSATWNFVRNTSSSTTTITTPQLADTLNANDTVITFNSLGQETARNLYSNSPGTNLLRTINTSWASNGTPATQVTILEDNTPYVQSEVDTTIDSNGLLDSMAEYDWGTGSRGALLRTTTLTYNTSSNYTSRNIIDLVTSKVITDVNSTVQYRQNITYDGVTLASCPGGALQHDDTNYPCTMNYRGNPTSVTTYITPATSSGPVTKNFSYDFFGNLITAQLNCCQQKTWTYSSTTQYSEPDKVVSGNSPSLTTYATYNQYTGQVANSTDANNQVTAYYYDFLRRLTKVVRPDNAQITTAYDDVNFKTTTSAPIDSSRTVQQIVAADPLGRPLTTTVEDANNNVYSIVQNKYDLAGRAYSTSNPYTSSPQFWTTASFDALGRTVYVTAQDNSQTNYSYSLQTVTVTDPAGKKRESVVDGAGRLLTVYEPDVTTQGNPLTIPTTYTYDVLDDLTKVASGSLQSRIYSYDALGRLTSSTTPESGLVQFQYDNFDNLTQRTDARNVATSYSYDGLNRLAGVTYTIPSGSGVQQAPSSSAPNTVCNNPLLGQGLNSNVCFYYDQGGSSAYALGRLTEMVDPSGSETYSYNLLGEETQLQKVIASATYTTQYAYNSAGELTQATYPSGRVLQQSVDAIGRLCEIATSTTGCNTSSSPFATGYTYSTTPSMPMVLTGFTYGNGVGASFGYSTDGRLQLTSLAYSKSGTTLFGLNYYYKNSSSCSAGASGNNGQIQCISDSKDGGRTVAYTYDPLGRLSTALTNGSSGYPQWGLSWTYDRYGNRWAQTATAGSGLPQPNVTVDPATNHINSTGYAYDASGNATNDGFNTLVYDAENHAVSVSNMSASAAYTYDANGLRVKKAVTSGTTTVYIFSGSKVIAEYDNGAAVGSPSREYIYSGGALIAKIENSATVYYHQDGLSARIMTDSSGNVITQQGHYPYGELWYQSGTGTKWTFTTYERDAESTNDFAIARYYRNALGRFNSPDPLSGSISDPQSLDRYTYSGDDPADLEDPSGSCPSMGAFIVAGKVLCVAADESGGSQQLGNISAPWWGIGFWDLADSGYYSYDFSAALPLSPKYNGYESFSLPVDAVFDARVSENSGAAEAERMGVTQDSLNEIGSLDMIGGSGMTKEEAQFDLCKNLTGDSNVQHNLTFSGFQSAQAASSASGVYVSDVLALWSNEGSLNSNFGPPGAHGEIGPIQIRRGVVNELTDAGILPANYNSNTTANLTAGALYYSRLLNHYGVPQNQAAAAYNGGPYGYANNKAAQAYQQAFNYRTSLYLALVICAGGN